MTLVLLTGFFVAGVNGGKACNTFPMVGTNFFITKNHFNSDIPLWKNFTENKLVTQVNHRTLASLMTLMVTWRVYKLLGLAGLSRTSKIASGLLLAAVWT
jgi:heme A synthase